MYTIDEARFSETTWKLLGLIISEQQKRQYPYGNVERILSEYRMK